MRVAEIVQQLSRLGSIRALLEHHPDLDREQVDAALAHAANLAEEDERPREPLSPVYRAYNGFMLGLFTGGLMFFEVRGEIGLKERAARRIGEFLLELGAELESEMDFEAIAGAGEEGIDAAVRDLDATLADYYQLGLAAFRYIVERIADNPTGEAEADGQQLLHQLGHPPVLFDRLRVEAPGAGDGEGKGKLWNELMTGCLQLAREMLLGFPEEPETCFVALPFIDPYEERYLNLYRGAARRTGKRSIRAWGALAREDHQELLLVLISRCGALLAEVTEPNANVTLEVGFALGQNKRVYLVAEGETWRSTANIQLDWVYPYQIGEQEDWELEAAERAGLYFTTLETVRRPGPVPSFAVKPIVVLSALAEAMAAGSGEGGEA